MCPINKINIILKDTKILNIKQYFLILPKRPAFFSIKENIKIYVNLHFQEFYFLDLLNVVKDK